MKTHSNYLKNLDVLPNQTVDFMWPNFYTILALLRRPYQSFLNDYFQAANQLETRQI